MTPLGMGVADNQRFQNNLIRYSGGHKLSRHLLHFFIFIFMYVVIFFLCKESCNKSLLLLLNKKIITIIQHTTHALSPKG
jgi:hypothetical protein